MDDTRTWDPYSPASDTAKQSGKKVAGAPKPAPARTSKAKTESDKAS